ncbi:MAG: tetratricopeptide repeat protein [Candidatus Omnitrophica bacterium]|nr:tetratricopeptide repeat protein [Candidatus Omnitrophota bacterium]
MGKRLNLLVILLFVVTAFALYFGVLDAGFVWDDEFIVVNNPLVRAPLSSFEIFRQDIINSGFNTTIYYRPLQILSYAVEYRLAGMQPFVFHFSNIILHIINALLVVLVTRRLARDDALSFLAGFIFLVHPAFAGLVSYISSRADLLYFFFGFLSFLFFIEYREKENKRHFALSVCFLVLAVLSREAAVIFPLLFLLADLLLLRRGKRETLRVHAPLFLISAAYLFFHWLALGERYPVLAGGQGLFESLFLFSAMLCRYIILAFAPWGFFMRTAEAADPSAGVYAVLLVPAAILALSRKKHTVLFGLAFFVAAFLPLLFVRGYFRVIADHWLYLPGYGLFLMFAAFFLEVFRSGGPYRRYALGVLMAVYLAFLAYGSSRYSDAWQSDISLSDKVLSGSSTDVNAMHFKALALLREGDTEEALSIIDEYAELYPEEPRSWYIKGRMYLTAERWREAGEAFRRALQASRDYDKAYLGLGLVSLAEEDTEEGIRYLEKALASNPYNHEAVLVLTSVYSRLGRDAEAFETAKRGLVANPYSLEMLINMGTAYSRAGKLKKAAMSYLQAAGLYPEDPRAFYNLSRIFYKSGDKLRARHFAEKALQADPGFAPATRFLREIDRPDAN